MQLTVTNSNVFKNFNGIFDMHFQPIKKGFEFGNCNLPTENVENKHLRWSLKQIRIYPENAKSKL